MGATQSAPSSIGEDPLLSIDSIDAYYGTAMALNDISLDVEQGSVTAVIGPNGAGKSTLMDCITGFKEYTGSITFRGQSIEALNAWDLGGEIAYCTESGNLFGDMGVLENLKLGGYSSSEDLDENLEYVFDLFPRLEERRSQQAKSLSGGEQQMLSIGRALMTDADFVILDEPSLGLAPTIIDDISNALDEIHSDGKTILLAEQNVQLAFDHGEQIYLLENGQIEADGTPAELEGDKYIRETYFG